MGDGAERLANSIAVLPFANMSEDSANEYFCDGVAEEILHRLRTIAGLNVIGRTSSFAFKGSDFGIEKISTLPGVRYVLQGSVRKAGNHLRISTQLLDQSGRQVWSQSFDRQLENIFEIQSEIATAVASTVASRVVPEPDTRHQPQLEAYEHFLAGRTLLHRRDWMPAREQLQKAVAIDPEFAEAHAELAITETLSGGPEDLDLARQSIDRALKLKPRLLRAQAAQGLWLMSSTPKDLAGAERVLRELLAQDPNMSDALLWLSNTLHEQRRDAEARPILERAALIDPLHPSIAANLADRLYQDGRADRAERIFERLLSQPTPGTLAFIAAGQFFWSTGRLVKANAVAKAEVLQNTHPSGWRSFPAALSYAALGDWPQCEAWIDRGLGQSPSTPAWLFRRVALPGWQGQTELAARRMRESLDELKLKGGVLQPVQQEIAGIHLARGGDYASAIELLEPAVDPGSPGSSFFVVPSFLHGAHALTWAYRHTGAEVKAARLLAAEAHECADTLAATGTRSSYDLHRCAETELLLGNVEGALERLERAVDAGWREYYLRQNDPYWASVADHPRYRAAMAKAKADVDRQRAEVRRIDAREDFPAKLDAKIAAEKTRAP